LEKELVIVDDILDGAVFDHHLLVVAVALRGHPGLNRTADENVDLDIFSFFGRKIEKLHVSFQKIDVFLLLAFAP